MNVLAQQDPDVWAAIRDEAQRQQDGLEMIASENYTSAAVMQAVGSVLTNKYAEGYPGRRYYGGCEYVDVVEDLARNRAKQLFGAEHANVQPHAGSQANLAVYLSVLEPGDTVLGLDLAHGGHLTHGMKLNISGRALQLHPLRRDSRHAPHRLRPGGAAGPRAQAEADRRRGERLSARDSARRRSPRSPGKCGAKLFVDMAHYAGLVAAGLHTIRSRSPTSSRRRRTRRSAARARDCPVPARNTPRTSTATSFPGMQGGPLMHVVAGKAVCFGEALRPDFKVYAQQILDNAKALAETLLAGGLRLVSAAAPTIT